MKRLSIAILGLLLFTSCNEKSKTDQEIKPIVRDWKIENGKLYKNGEWLFQKIGKPLRNFADKNAVAQLISDLPILKKKGFTTIEINCYWHHFDNDGDGQIDYSLQPLKSLIDSIYQLDMMPCLSVETYAVGGGQLPEGFWKKYPDADAIDAKGKPVSDTEYGFGSRVVSIFHNGYREAARTFIKNLTKEIDHSKILYFETTVEPQYTGTIDLCYSTHARQAYTEWITINQIQNAQPMPSTFPIPSSFIEDPIWNKFRAQFLAEWINADAEAFREIAGKNAYIAVDYLDADEHSMIKRNGNPEEFLANINGANIIQINWTWYFPEDKPNQKAYDRVHAANKKFNKNWAIAEHMTFNGSDFNHFSESRLNDILNNTLKQGNKFGWEFVSIENSTKGTFSMYNDDWSPKKPMGVVDHNWQSWLNKIYKDYK